VWPGFAHCRPIINVDATFLIGKYKCTLMIAVDMIAENQLLSLAFALVEVRIMRAGHGFLAMSENKLQVLVDPFA
jgi:hypothetical protein